MKISTKEKKCEIGNWKITIHDGKISIYDYDRHSDNPKWRLSMMLDSDIDFTLELENYFHEYEDCIDLKITKKGYDILIDEAKKQKS